VFQTCCTLCRA